MQAAKNGRAALAPTSDTTKAFTPLKKGVGVGVGGDAKKIGQVSQSYSDASMGSSVGSSGGGGSRGGVSSSVSGQSSGSDGPVRALQRRFGCSHNINQSRRRAHDRSH